MVQTLRLTLSANLPIGAFEALASSTSFIICDIVVSSPTFSALNSIAPFLLILPEITLLPISFFTGICSPVIVDSSIYVCPFTITPSTAIVSPGFTRIISPTFTSSIGISISFCSLKIVTFLGVKSNK